MRLLRNTSPNVPKIEPDYVGQVATPRSFGDGQELAGLQENAQLSGCPGSQYFQAETGPWFGAL